MIMSDFLEKYNLKIQGKVINEKESNKKETEDTVCTYRVFIIMMMTCC